MNRMVSGIEVPRKRRPEAVENRTRLLHAARQVFAVSGPDARVEEIAQAAGVGMGTFYRNFGSKQALVDELVADVRRRLLALATKAGTLESLILDAGRAQARDPGYMSFLWSRSTAGQAAVDEFLDILAGLLAAAQDDGRVRADLSVTDVWMALWSLRAVLEMTRRSAPAAWKRHVDLLIAGMRPGTPLTAKPMTLPQARRCIAEASR